MNKCWWRLALLGAMALACAAVHAQSAAVSETGPALSVSALSRAELLTQVRAQLLNWGTHDGHAPDIHQLGMWRVPARFDSVPRLHATVRPTSDGVRQVDVAIFADEAGVVPAGGLRFVLRDPVPVWVADRALSRGDRIQCEAFRREWRMARSPRAQVGDACPGDVPARLRRPLAAGEALMSSDLLPLSAVQDRQSARLTVRVGAIQVEARGVALADAQVGQVLPVKVDTSAAVLKAVVIAPGELRLGESVQ